ncbi:uncharacterized protein LOC126897679 [Daktulosphaira vitifoliae]|uniref:uncharacterized protein LOC126897679 n=1 Tax=Daktulosphaira vitifoliae TaxID=58002 RepID=UPI0021A9A459|nr:uncharacterized protein LOC126897679 [Daktulosphaira vitifoliae]
MNYQLFLLKLLKFLLFYNYTNADLIDFQQEQGERVVKTPRRISIPVHYVSGTHYEVGFSVGRTYKSMINDYLQKYSPLQNYLKLFEEPEGRKIYEESLSATEKYFPQYIVELRGIADGSQAPFEQLFLVALDDTLPMSLNKEYVDKGPVGCSSLMINQLNGQFLGHTEDAFSASEDNFYIIAAHIIPSKNESGGVFKAREEKFEALAYAGHLPGLASGHNYHGLVFSINTLSVSKNVRGRIPREFITRALLSSKANMTEVIEILSNEGAGTADGFNVNLVFLNLSRESRVFHSIEVAPNYNNSQSKLSIVDFPIGSNSFHANRLLHLLHSEIQENLPYEDSIIRENVYKQITKNKTLSSFEDVLQVLGSEEMFSNVPNEFGGTIHLGVFDLTKKIWMMWNNNPIYNSPLLQLPLTFVDLITSPKNQ